MDVDQFFSNFDRIDCPVNNHDTSDPLNALCDDQLINTVMEPLGSQDADVMNLYHYVDRNILKPLAYRVRERQNMSGLLMDIFRLDGKSQLFYGQPMVSNFNKF